MDNPAPQINIIKPDGGGGLHLPRISPVVVIVTTLLLAIVTAASVFLLYSKRNQPVAPTAAPSANASTTQTISDTFSGTGAPDSSKWNYVVPTGGGSVSQQNGQLSMLLPANPATASAFTAQGNGTQYFTGDFSAKVDLAGIQTTGTAWEELSFGSPSLISVRRTKSPTVDTVGNVTLPAGTGIITVELRRVGSIVQAFYNLPGGNQVLLSTQATGANILADGALYLTASTESPGFLAATATFDNFTASVNFAAVQPTPVPGSAAACALTFTVLDTTATGTPTPTPTASPTPTPTVTGTPPPTPTGTINPTATPTPTVTPTPPPGATATPTLEPTPTPTTPVAIGPTPTPVVLQTAGDMTGTWALGIGGALILGLGAVLMLVF